MKTSTSWKLVLAALTVAASACGFFPFSRTSRQGADVLEQAPKPAPVDSEFGGCGAEGSQPDYALNRRKNRIDSGAYVPVDWNVIARLPWPRQVGYRFRNQWGRGETREVARYEGAAVSMEGFVVGYKLEIPEPPNCYSDEPSRKDYHLWLARLPGNGPKQGVVVEVTPRVRARHVRWTSESIDSLQRSRVRIRVSGWLMLDQMHPELVGKNRITLWEVHPITRIEWLNAAGQWVSLDSLVRLPSLREDRK